MSLHPADERLRDWLAGSMPDDVTDHVETCEECADRLESLTVDEPSVAAALHEVLPVADDVAPRVYDRVQVALENREALDAFVGLFGVAVETARIVFEEEDR